MLALLTAIALAQPASSPVLLSDPPSRIQPVAPTPAEPAPAALRLAQAVAPDPLTGVQAGSLLQDGEDLFVARDGHVLRVPKDGPPVEVTYIDDGVKRIVPAGKDLLLSSRQKVYRAPRAGGAPVVVMEAPKPSSSYMPESTIVNITVDGDDLYVSAGMQLLRLKHGETAPVVLDEANMAVIPVVVVQGPRVLEAVGHELRRFARDGGDVLLFADLARGDSEAVILDVVEDGPDLVVVVGRQVLRVKPDASVSVLATLEAPQDLAVDGNNVYVADRKRGILQLHKGDNALTVIDPRPANSLVQSETGLAWIALDQRDTALVRAKKPKASPPTKGTPNTAPLTCKDGLHSACQADCDKGDGAACLTAAAPILDGRGGFARDFAVGLPLLLKGCDAKTPSVKACSLAAALLAYDMPPLKADKKASRAMLERACTLDARECGELANALEWDPEHPDADRARALRNKACDAGSGKACDRLSSDLKRVGDTAGAKTLHDKACALEPTLSSCK